MFERKMFVFRKVERKDCVIMSHICVVFRYIFLLYYGYVGLMGIYTLQYFLRETSVSALV